MLPCMATCQVAHKDPLSLAPPERGQPDLNHKSHLMPGKAEAAGCSMHRLGIG